MSATRVRVGLLGCGNVGGALAEVLLADRERIARRTGTDLELRAVAVRDIARPRPPALPADLLTLDAGAVVTDPGVDLVVEVMGGIEPARSLVLAALGAGKPVVTANKELLASCGAELWGAAARAGRDLLFEAAVAGGVPLIRPLRESLAGERIRRVLGIVNGTTNYILSGMAESGATYAEALAEAQHLGLAEADPTADVEGFDAAAKAAIIANVAFGAGVVAGEVDREGIASIGPDDITAARRLGFAIKLLAVVEEIDGAIAARVHPAMVPLTHPLASVRGSFNAVFVEGATVGDLMFLGRGAGGAPSASAVLGDLLDAAHNLSVGGSGRTPALAALPRRPIEDLVGAYYLTLDVVDRPGVLHAVSGVLGAHSVSVRSMEQEGADEGARLVFVTHPARERDVQACLRELHGLDAVRRIGGLIRVVDQ